MKAEEIKVVYGYPGAAICPFYDALLDADKDIKHVLVRHEANGGHAASGYARISGKARGLYSDFRSRCGGT
ncbi:thiamine pyrophosphate-binding protein [Ruminococcus albus]|uniref:thiamine pyrophosphate-binding protein n=1 Tax=Ruminococcus albus TaxID=1264 RepID=UPI000467C1B7